jgi:hypothetical protein
VGDKIYSDFSFSPNFAPTSTFSFTNTPTDQHTFSGAGLAMTPGNYTYSYKMAIVAGTGTTFAAYRTGSSTSDVFNALVATKTLSANPASVPATVTSTDGIVSLVATYSPTVPGPLTFSSTINVTSGRMDIFTDSVVQQEVSATPGPLPILGAAAAFGSLRKLRKLSSLLNA